MAEKISYNDIRDINEDWSLDKRNNLPYSGLSVQKFIKKTLNSKGGDFYYDSDTNKYLIFADVESRDLYLSDRETYADLIIGTFDAPANYTAEINMETPSSNVILEGAEGNYIDFTFDIKNKNGSSTGEAVVATFTFNNGGNVKKITQIYNAGTNVHFLIDSYLSQGTNIINVVITGRNSMVSTMAAVTYTVVALKLTSDFDFSRSTEIGQYLSIPYYLEGAGVKYVEWYVDGVKLGDVDTITDLKTNRVKNINTTNFDPGKHNIQFRAYVTDNGNNFYSNTLYYDFVTCPEHEEWENSVTYVLLGLMLREPTNTTINISLKQYEEFTYQASVYDSRKRALNLIISDNGTQIQSITSYADEISDLSYTPTTIGTHNLTFNADGAIAAITTVVEDGGIGINEVTNGLLLKLSAKGRSNEETNPGTWTFTPEAQGASTITTTFNGFDWNEQSGWYNDTLVIPVGSSIDINFAPLNGNPIAHGRTIEIDYETSYVLDDSASVMNLTNPTTNAGIQVTASTAKLQSSGGVSINTKYKDGDRIHLAFIINRIDGDNECLMFIVNNGILERAAKFSESDSFRVDNNIHIGSDGCVVKIHSIRVYDTALTADEAFANYAVDSNNLLEIANKNDILNDTTGMIDVDKVNAKIPVMIITGNIDYIMSINDKAHKNDWNTYPVQIEFRDMQNPEKNFFIDNANIRLQGTSSISYPRKNFRIYSVKQKKASFDSKFYSPTHNESDLIESGKYSFKNGAAPVTCWCLKADFAESSGSHNTGIARRWNDVMKNVNNDGNYVLRTEAQKWATQNNYPYDVRTTIDGFPIVLFQRNDESAPMVCLGQYNFNNDKSTEDVFGFTALSMEGVTPFDNSKVECWEVLSSDESIALFTDVSDFDNKWDESFEARYPDGNTDVAALKRVCQFVNSCYDSTNDTVNVETWRAGKANHFDMNKLAAYYIYLLRFGAVDQTVKNAMFTTEDGMHWFYINYDNDTVLGIDNESHQFDTWDYGLFTRTPEGGYYYAGKGKSVLWRCFEADSECMTLARQIDALLFNAGLKYETVCDTFDNQQSGQWCERIFNENGYYKYISPLSEGKSYLHMLQGSRTSHRHWWLQHRFEKYDNAFGNGTYSIRSIQARATGTVAIPQGAAYKFTPAITSYFGYSVASTTVDAPTERTVGVEYTATGLPQATGGGNLIYIYNANNIESIDLSPYINALGSLNISSAVDVNGNSNLKKLILGDGTGINNYLPVISGLGVIKSLEEIDIRGYKAITNIDLGDNINLHVFKADNSGLTSFIPAPGVILTNAVLPTVLQAISLNGANVTSITYTPTSTLRSVSLKNITGIWDAKNFVNTWLSGLTDTQLAQADLTLTSINWTGMTATQAIQIGKVGTKNLQGKITLVSLNQSEYQQLVELFGQTVFENQGSFTIDAPETVLLMGPTELIEGSSATYTATSFPLSDKTTLYLLYNGSTLISPQTDAQGKVYRTYGGVTLYEESGAISVSTGLTVDVTVKIRAQISGTTTYSDYITLNAVKATYPSVVVINGDEMIIQNGFYNYTYTFRGSYNTELTGVTWYLANNNYCSITQSSISGATITVTNTPATAVTVTLMCTASFTGGVSITGRKNITLQLTFPSNITINGDSTLSDNGSYTYTKAFDTDTYTASLINVAWTISENNYVIISASDNNTATLYIGKGNPSAMNVTLTCTATFTGGVTRSGNKTIAVTQITPPPIEQWVDLGLPSGTLWCTHNLGAENPEDTGLYFAWGETTGYVDTTARNTALSRNDGFSNDAYTQTGGAAITDTTLIKAHDAAYTMMGGFACIPTSDDFDELLANCNKSYEYVGADTLLVLRSRINNNSIKILLAHYYRNMGKESPNYYWTSSKISSNPRSLHVLEYESPYVGSDIPGFCGCPIRPICRPPQLVDLGLPSGTLWADRNLGADSPEDYGEYFMWGEKKGHLPGTLYFDSGPYKAQGLNAITANLSLSQDAANIALGGDYHMADLSDFVELEKNCTHEIVTENDVKKLKFTSTINGNSIIFPLAGYIDYGYKTPININYTARFWSTQYMNEYSSWSRTYEYNSSYNGYTKGMERYAGCPIRPILN